MEQKQEFACTTLEFNLLSKIKKIGLPIPTYPCNFCTYEVSVKLFILK